jgi:hypothetical protein
LETHCFSSAGDYLIPISGGLVQGQPAAVDLSWTTNKVTGSGITYSAILLDGLPDKQETAPGKIEPQQARERKHTTPTSPELILHSGALSFHQKCWTA